MSAQPADERESASEHVNENSAAAPPEAPQADGPGRRRPPRIKEGDEDAIPALEPAAPLASRLDPQRTHRRFFVDRLRETPSWLTSLTAHLALLLLLGSYIVPPGPRSRTFDLLMLFTESDDRREEGDLVVVHTTMWETEANKDTGDEGPDAEAAEQEENPVEEPAPAEQPQPVEPLAVKEDDESGDLAEPSEIVFDEGEEIPGELDTLFDASADATVRVGGTFRNIVVPPGFDDVTEKDQIVDDFIEYDVGRLRGQAGQVANQRFQRLGRDAIPALVRGLNKSAYIRASCPVVVISQKLENELRKSNDPVMIQFAIDRLGQGVPASAPHASRVYGLRERLRKQFISLEEELVGTANEWALPATEELIRLATEAAGSTDTLKKRLASEDPVERGSALLASSLHARRMNRDARYALGMYMADRLEKERDLRMAQVYHEAMGKLAFDCRNEVPGELAVNPVQLASAWRNAWRGNRAAWREREAADLLAKARREKRGGRTVTSANTLRTISERYPETPQAIEASNMIGKLDFDRIASAQFNRAMTLEKAGNPQAALRQYEDIQIRFPETKAAELARNRVNRIRGGAAGSE